MSYQLGYMGGYTWTFYHYFFQGRYLTSITFCLLSYTLHMLLRSLYLKSDPKNLTMCSTLQKVGHSDLVFSFVTVNCDGGIHALM